MLGHKAVTTGVAGPEIADDVVRQVGGRFGSHHGVGADRAGWQIAPAGIGSVRDGLDRIALKDLAQRTGGRAFFPDKKFDLNAAFAEIEKELRTQYLIAYSSTNKNRDGSYRKISIEVTNPELKKEKLEIRHRPGYYAKT